MVAMRLFGRRTSFATDDFFFLGILQFIIFFPWLGWVPVMYASFLRTRPSCSGSRELLLLDISLPGLCALFFLNWFLALLFIVFSCRGTISNPKPRRHVATLVYIKLFVAILDIAWATLGTVILFRNSYCDIIGVELVIKVCTIFQWVATIVRLCFIILFYDWDFSKKKDNIAREYLTNPQRGSTFNKWSLSIQGLFLLCTTASDERKQAFRVASQLLAMLTNDVDLVPSDVIAGLLILRRKCAKLWEAENEALTQLPPITTADGEKLVQFPPENFAPWMNLKEAHHYFKLGMGVYGWWWFVFKHLACGCCLLVRHLTCCFPFRKKANIVEGDNCCGCETTGLQMTTKLIYEDLVLISFKNSVYEVPFFVAFDHPTSTVLITVRGTMSMNDVMTDLTCTFANMDDPGCPPGAICHAGMLNTARQIKKKLEDTGILEKILRERPDYQIVLVGHSLGGAVSSILTVLLKAQYSNVKCYAFAPCPTMNRVVQPYIQDNVFTIIYGNDCCSCINYELVKEVVLDIQEAVKECNLPKYKIYLSNKKVSKDLERVEPQSILSKEESCSSNGSSKPQYGAVAINEGRSIVPATESSYLVGRILHIYPRKDGYRLKITNPEYYNKIIFRPKMLLDHVPLYMERALEHLKETETLTESSLKFDDMVFSH